MGLFSDAIIESGRRNAEITSAGKRIQTRSKGMASPTVFSQTKRELIKPHHQAAVAAIVTRQ